MIARTAGPTPRTAPVLDQVALHVADEGDRPAEPRRAEAQEVAHQAAQRARSGGTAGLGWGDRLTHGGAIWAIPVTGPPGARHDAAGSARPPMFATYEQSFLRG